MCRISGGFALRPTARVIRAGMKDQDPRRGARRGAEGDAPDGHSGSKVLGEGPCDSRGTGRESPSKLRLLFCPRGVRMRRPQQRSVAKDDPQWDCFRTGQAGTKSLNPVTAQQRTPQQSGEACRQDPGGRHRRCPVAGHSRRSRRRRHWRRSPAHPFETGITAMLLCAIAFVEPFAFFFHTQLPLGQTEFDAAAPTRHCRKARSLRLAADDRHGRLGGTGSASLVQIAARDGRVRPACRRRGILDGCARRRHCAYRFRRA